MSTTMSFVSWTVALIVLVLAGVWTFSYFASESTLPVQPVDYHVATTTENTATSTASTTEE